MDPWYLFAAFLVVVGACVMTRADVWLHGPLGRAKTAVVGARWGFWLSVVMYAWLIDSRRIPFSDNGLTGFLLAGVALAALLAWVVNRK